MVGLVHFGCRCFLFMSSVHHCPVDANPLYSDDGSRKCLMPTRLFSHSCIFAGLPDMMGDVYHVLDKPRFCMLDFVG